MLPLSEKVYFFRVLIALFIGVFGLASCESEGTATDQIEGNDEPDGVPEMTALPTSLDSAQAETYIAYFQNESVQNSDDDFFFSEGTDTTRVNTFHLDPEQDSAFYSRLDSFKTNTSVAVEIAIHMALRTSDEMQEDTELPNLAPLLGLILNNEIDDTYYPLRPLLMDLAGNTADVSLDCPVLLGCGEEDVSVSKKCVRGLIANWDSTPMPDISEQLYVDLDTSSASNRLRFYEFDTEDTDDIYNFLKSRADEGKPNYFYVHLGQVIEGPDCIPIRTILHLDTAAIDANYFTEPGDGDDPAYYEFARPCPPYCDTAKMVINN